MRNGYKLFWSDRALEDLQKIIDYLTENWSQKEIKTFVQKLDKRLLLILMNPLLFPSTKRRKSVRRSVLTPQTVIYYQIKENSVSIVTLFDSRQSPRKLKL